MTPWGMPGNAHDTSTTAQPIVVTPPLRDLLPTHDQREINRRVAANIFSTSAHSGDASPHARSERYDRRAAANPTNVNRDLHATQHPLILNATTTRDAPGMREG
eukprot:CAMPEP_0172528616 /NCGR_PEP_ID=MMETSP1067-20121228/2958_1 /TAXON_ID=265564 ORGANISM="Thalassiosira punctigera, Strain Tpunct2005C2" /NCGR_SAMPLE_ID=MMETSP1067 /ASSEMBLY_ACC=CAM_ASM_000444 /LENGTH=103 /DNA_ID=CAMNT_0013312561 /DNA_START=362 /DNA_END=669 /DNA_ORIENTATION=+